MKILKIVTLFISMCISILGITNINSINKVNINEIKETIPIKTEIVISDRVNIKMKKEQEQINIADKKEKIIIKKEIDRIKENHNKNNIKKIQNMSIEKEKIKQEETEQEVIKEENQNDKSDCEELKIEQESINHLLEIGEEKKEPRLLKDKTMKINFDN